jgi:hypothetical protein
MQGLLLHGVVTSASVHDRDGGILLLSALFGMFPFLKKLFADSAYDPARSRALSFCRNAGLLDAPSAGSTAAVGSPKITSRSTPTTGSMRFIAMSSFGSSMRITMNMVFS